MNIANLKLAVQFIRMLPPRLFNLDTLLDGGSIGVDENGKPIGDESIEFSERPGCGSTGCVIGWCTVMPEFRQQGLSFDNEKYKLMLKGDFVHYEDAAMVMFGISERDALDLFSHTGSSQWDPERDEDVFAEDDYEDYGQRHLEFFERRLDGFCKKHSLNKDEVFA